MTDFRARLQAALDSAYTIERELGGGGMSRVFAADELALGRKVVVKILPEETAGALSIQRFKREISLAARLHHPHIVPVLNAGEVDGIPFYTMPFVAGESLADRLRAPISVSEAVRILRAVASALSYAHGQHVVHRDIKPANILLAGGVATVTDFGVAKAVRAAVEAEGGGTTTGLTSFGVALGTPAYMSPEQAAADPDVDHRADLYALGCVAYEMLTGSAPFAGRSSQQLLAAHISETPPSVDLKAPSVPASLAQLVMRCLAKRPDARPQSADEFIATLDEVPTASGDTPTQRRRWFPSAIGVLALAAVVALTAVVAAVARRDAITDPATAPRSVGVLPFANLSGSKENEYFSDGMTQEITNALGKVPGLRVASQSMTSSRANDPDVRAIGRALGVQTILTGSVQREGDRVRINARLVNVDDGFQLWSDRYDGEVRDVFALQDTIARALAGSLRLELGAAGARPLVHAATADPEAYKLFLEGWYFFNRRTITNLRKSIALFQRAIARDPNYARAYGGLAMAYAVLVTYEDLNAASVNDSAIVAGRKAIALDSNVVEAYTGIGDAMAHLYRNREAIDAFERAIAIDSSFAPARQWFAEVLVHVGRVEQALVQIRRAQELEPLSLIINANVGRITLQARRYAEARAALRRTLELDSTFQVAHSLLGSLYLAERKYDSAISEITRAMELQGSRSTTYVTVLGYAHAVAGHRSEAEVLRREIMARAKTSPVSYSGLALLHHALGDTAQAIAALDTAVQRYDSWIAMTSREERFDALRRHPRGAALLASTEKY
jgi:TolB-like protein/Flp pilus assembly protein TadD